MLIMFIVSSLTYCNNVIINMLLYERSVVSYKQQSKLFEFVEKSLGRAC